MTTNTNDITGLPEPGTPIPRRRLNRKTHAAILSGDSDLLPAVETAKQEGVCVWLIHGPVRSRVDGTATYARELWDAVDERIELTQTFMDGVAR